MTQIDPWIFWQSITCAIPSINVRSTTEEKGGLWEVFNSIVIKNAADENRLQSN